jgi:hypothetical protein
MWLGARNPANIRRPGVAEGDRSYARTNGDRPLGALRLRHHEAAAASSPLYPRTPHPNEGLTAADRPRKLRACATSTV